MKPAATLAQVARSLQAEDDTESTLARACALAVQLIPGCDSAAVILIEGRRLLRTHGATEPAARRVDEIEFETGQGPCLGAIRHHEVLLVPDIRVDPRWPDFAARVYEETGMRSMLAFRLFAEADTMGALNLYSRTAGAFDRDSVELGAIFATHAGVALKGTQAVEVLRSALASRETIGVAIGILMARQAISRAEAFDVLRRASQRTNLKLRDIAERIASGGGDGTDQPEDLTGRALGG